MPLYHPRNKKTNKIKEKEKKIKIKYKGSNVP